MKTERCPAVVLEEDSPLSALLEGRSAAAVPPRADGIAIGLLDSIDPDGIGRVSIAAFGLSGLAARSLVALPRERIGEAVALGFEGADPNRPLVLGFLLLAAPQAAVSETHPATIRHENGRLLIEAEAGVELRCGDSHVILDADGHIYIRGAYVTSHASAGQRIRGGSVQIN